VDGAERPVTTVAPAGARYLAATAVAAAVRRLVISIESSSASSSPDSASNRATTPWIVGSPRRRGLSGKFAFTLAAKYGRPRAIPALLM
jgi:hypothetical protein